MASEGNFCEHKSSWAGVVTSEGVTWFGLSIIAVIVCISTVVVHLLLRVIGRRNYVVDRKFEELGALIKSTAIRMATIAARDGESTEWLNLLLQNAWHAGLFSNLETKLRRTLENRLDYMIDARDEEDTAKRVPAWVRKFRVDNFSMGRSCPVFESLTVVSNDLESKKLVIELDVSMNTTEADVQLTVAIHNGFHN
eukprot:CAMPEP_0198221954 /NCGR_PEP_ID=MMETSP1445-20131203/86021_1 /TAXON_ID=36898 /ORGANISM="Pyramimonas sp., Strain CCMP2087" /LENGTH=195 /DNA_ID=CAMNT_0043900289 /DNA_START=96 /DNA_END=680 /DNA_ORIENTATION=-